MKQEIPKPRRARVELEAIRAAHSELHERVSVPVTAPSRVRHSAYLLPNEEEQTRSAVRSAFHDVVRQLGIEPGAIQWGERAGSVEKTFSDGNLLRVVWELHTEFYSYTTTLVPPVRARSQDAFVEPYFLPAFPTTGSKLVDLDLMVVPGRKLGRAQRASLHGGIIYGGEVVNGEAHAWSTFQVDEWGQGRYVVAAGSLKPGRLGRLIRRLVEIETYYHLILLPLPEYRKQVVGLRETEKRIAAYSEDIAADLASREAKPEQEHRWLVYLTRDLADLIRLTERMRYRLSAANSYYAIFKDRLEWLRESPGGSYQTLSEFLIARVSPSMRNYNNFIERADALTAQLTSLGNMMRTRVSLNMEQQSLQTMNAMNQRAALQLRLQKTVEGLSLIVLSYYLTGLSNYIFKALEPLLPLPGNPTVWSAMTIPLWLGLAFWMTRRVKALVSSTPGGVEKGKSK
ncbi:MAG: DUF3422 domain-containing protein [SAR324 cluster bacterium]|nr:DUF3422 domain-containing protein [SAR324 cluster bacterium]